ncbi:hypothetical protein Tco_1511884 [Tanacetum coccineum]
MYKKRGAGGSGMRLLPNPKRTLWVLLKTTRTLWCGGCGGSEGGGGGVELVTRMAAMVMMVTSGGDVAVDGAAEPRWLWRGDEGGVMVAAVGRQPEEVEARGGEWIWGSGRSGHEDNIWFRPERSPKNFSGGDWPAGRVAGNYGEGECFISVCV